MVIIQLNSKQLEALLNKVVGKQLEKVLRGSHTSPPSSVQAADIFLNVEQVAEFLGLAKATIYAKTSKGEIPHSKVGKKLYFKTSELLQWIEEGKKSCQ